ncbi:Methyltransferase domain-containing protein [Singulisphaera sp. GP187]|uniref:class I SAM-dependent methyltransferase n=1 Tax=Singulisphaera sp. GP187 TaxID=1882752 RepID=UPI00092B7B18|nr:class I SAM-dependent methyltransferase [Singulisphaera sp. GP187]SIO28975.1 Methyltransferase domain-containing protein [Singulisphaera sp. GP187]
MELAELQKHWDAFGAEDPLWAIMTVPGKRFGRWDVNDFFETGRRQVASQVEYFHERGMHFNRGRVLDFGCGVGRLTQALGDSFQECDGVDISAAMIARARQHNRHGDRCRYHVNARDDLAIFADNTFDLVYTNIVLQHMQPKYARSYIAEFLRIIVPGGLVFFQMPAGTEPANPEPNPSSTISHRAPLPDSAFRAKISPTEHPATVWAGSQLELIVRVKNLSGCPWKATGRELDRLGLRLGNHWLNEQNQVVEYDDGRADLPGDLEPGEEVDLVLTINVPKVPGSYLLEIDMVEEFVSWFKDKGSETSVLPIEVKTPAAERDFTPQMQMHTIDKDEIISLINNHSGKILEIQRVNEGKGLLDYNYYVTK